MVLLELHGFYIQIPFYDLLIQALLVLPVITISLTGSKSSLLGLIRSKGQTLDRWFPTLSQPVSVAYLEANIDRSVRGLVLWVS